MSADINNAFAAMLSQLDQGRLLADCDSAMRQAVTAVRATGRSASVTIELTFQPVDREGARVDVVDAVNVSFPTMGSGMSIFYTADDGALLLSDPNQPDFDFGAGEPADAEALGDTPHE